MHVHGQGVTACFLFQGYEKKYAFHFLLRADNNNSVVFLGLHVHVVFGFLI